MRSRAQVQEFFDSATPGSLFLLQCDPLAASLRRIEHARYILEVILVACDLPPAIGPIMLELLRIAVRA